MPTAARQVKSALAVLLAASAAAANDFSVGGSGADLVPLSETRVSMRAEDIRIVFVERHWRITADYVFVNPTTAAVSLQIGFPEILCEPDVDCSARFWNLQTTVDGKPVIHRKGTLAKKHEWAQHLGTVWLFDAVFPPNGELHVRHTYAMSSDGSVDNVAGMTYVTRTGATWASPIQSARFTAVLPIEAFAVSGAWGRPETVTPTDGQRPYIELRVSHKDWVPKRDLGLVFYYTPPRLPKLPSDRLKRSGIQANDECVDPPNAETLEQLRMCKNLIFAISGYPFKDKQLRRYFYSAGDEWSLEPLEKDGPRYWQRTLSELPGFEYDTIPAPSRWLLDEMEKRVGLHLKATALPPSESALPERDKAPPHASVRRDAAPTPSSRSQATSTERAATASPQCACTMGRAGHPAAWVGSVLVGVTWGRRKRWSRALALGHRMRK